jgi:branched-chain amino acid transport system ATP-binding protein
MGGDAAAGVLLDTLVVRDLHTGYPGGPDVLRGVSVTVRDGEIVAVLGRNGAGKTTLLRAISGLLPCRSGDIELGGRSLRGVRPHRVARRGVGHVPEGRRVMPGMSVVDNLLLGAHRIGARRDADAVLAEVLEFFPTLRRALKAKAGTLSGGQQQMLAIARALMSRPQVLLLDEPLTGLAPVIQDDVMTTLAGLRTADRTIVLVEQNAQRSLAVADRGVVLADGVVVVRGAARELLADPAVREGYLGADPSARLPTDGGDRP